MSKSYAWMAVAAVVLLAAALRAIGLDHTFPGGGEVVLAPDDAQYHARRALYSFLNFPDVLLWDAYLNYPKGAYIPWPPLYDWSLAAAARCFGSSVTTFERTLAWAPVALGAATTLAVYAAARQVAAIGTALGAAVIHAVLPASVVYSRVGNPDHHAAVAFIGASLLALSMASLRSSASARRVWALQALLVLCRLAMMLSWHGSVLYLALGEGVLLAVAATCGMRDVLRALAVGQLASALAIAPFVGISGSAVGGPLSPIELSLLHPLLLGLCGCIAAAASELERRSPAATPVRKAVRTFALAAGVGLATVLVPAVREGLVWAWEYVGGDEHWIAANFEARPLFAGGARRATEVFGFAAFLLPLVPVAALWRARWTAVRAPAIALACWSAPLCVLALSNTRYGNDLAPAASIGVALLVADGSRAACARLGLADGTRTAAAVALVGLLLWPALGVYATRGPASIAHALAIASGRSAPDRMAVPNLSQSIHEFALEVRASTPETAGYEDVDELPAYGVLAPPTLGFALKYDARRPTPADNFGPYLGPPGLDLTRRFYSATDEARAVELARRLRARYVVTTIDGKPRKSMLIHRLQAGDGVGRRGQPRLEHFRLITEAPRRGVALGALSGLAPRVVASPYKLFELVEGAILAVAAEPGAEVTAQVEIVTSTGRGFTYRAIAQADEIGAATIRFPYATSTDAPSRPRGKVRIHSGDLETEVDVSDDDVRSGARVAVRLAPESP